MAHWAKLKEKSAGYKRLFLTFFIYRVFGLKAVYLIAFFISFFTFIFAFELRQNLKKYFSVIYPLARISPNMINCFKLIFSYALCLSDKISIFHGDFNPENLIFKNENIKNELYSDLKNKKGAVFVFTHIGSIEAMELLFLDKTNQFDIKVNTFLSGAQSKIFNNFLSQIKKEIPLNIIKADEFDISCAIKLKEKLSLGEVLFISGDRTSEKEISRTFEGEIFNKKIKLPLGTFKLALRSAVPVYFISCLRCKNKYEIYLERAQNLTLQGLKNDFSRYLEKVVSMYPFQFFHFYDYFSD